MYFCQRRYVKGMYFVKSWVCIRYVFFKTRYVLNTCIPVNSNLNNTSGTISSKIFQVVELSECWCLLTITNFQTLCLS